MIGMVFGRLLVLERDGSDNYGKKKFKCQCNCGKITTVIGKSLRNQSTRSCGCLKADLLRRENPKSKHPMYTSWIQMKQRCFNKKAAKYPWYGGSGITVCDRWLESFDNFLEDMGERPEGMSLDRIDNLGNYCKENCKWSTPKEQSNNRRKRNSVTF